VRCAQAGRRPVAHQSRGPRATDRPRPLRKLGSLSAPRLCGGIEAQSTAYPCLAPRMAAKLTTPGFHPRRVLEDPRGRIALLLPAESGRGLATPPVCVPPASSGAASPIPRSRRSAARVLMDEGWAESNRSARSGDNKCQAKRAHHRLSWQRRAVAHPTTQARGTAPRPVWRTSRALPPAHRSCRSRRCGRDRTPGCAWRCAPLRGGGR
jgi:hypothetical protein